MATVFQLPATVPPMPAVARILSKYDRPHLAAFIAVAIDLLDVLGPDPEAEDSDTDEAVGDEQDCAWTEWQMRGRHKLAGGKTEPVSIEDAEDDDPDTCAAADDIGSGPSFFHGSDGMPGDAADAEPEHDAETRMW